MQGEWNLDLSKGYQFKTELVYEKGKQVIEIDSPSFLGGNGNRPGPMAYCVAGIASCFIATFVSVAATKGIRLSKLNVNTECMINFAKTFDVADEPITEGIDFQIETESDNADKQQLQELVNMEENERQEYKFIRNQKILSIWVAMHCKKKKITLLLKIQCLVGVILFISSSSIPF